MITISSKKMTVSLSFLFLSLISIWSAIICSLSNSQIESKAIENSSGTTFKSAEVITGTTVGQYSNDDWILTVGGNEHMVGASSTYSSRAILGDHINVTAFDSSINRTTKNVAAIIARKPFSNITSVNFKIGTGSNGAYLGVLTYLVVCDSLTSDYTLLGELGNITTTAKEYSFDRIEKDKYYAIVFYNPNGAYNLGNVEITFNSSLTYSKVTSSDQLYFGHTYMLVDEVNNKAVSYLEDTHLKSSSVVISNSKIENNDNILTFTLLPGVIVDTYCLKINNNQASDEYLYLDEEGVISSITMGENTSYHLRVVNSSISITTSSGYSLKYDYASDAFVTTSEKSEVVLYKLDSKIDYQQEASIFIDVVNTQGLNKSGECNALFVYLDNIYSRLSIEGLNEYETSDEVDFIEARERMDYLSRWYTLKDNRVQPTNYQTDSKIIPLILIVILSLSSIMIYVHNKRFYQN